ncbi:MAG: TFIIB-type zinc ribbon-containing protein [Blastocatellia bacterium]|nr:TFIIB-type zinc ribbon-containing protein [Blastocatellia bacterium]
MKCPECGTDARTGTRFCRNCGEMLPAEETLAMEAPKPGAAPASSVPPSAVAQSTVPMSALKTGPNAPANLPTMPMQSAFPGAVMAEPAKPAPAPETPRPVQMFQAQSPSPAPPPNTPPQPPAPALSTPPQPTPLQATIAAPQPPLKPPSAPAFPPAAPPAPPANQGYGPPLASFAPPPQAHNHNLAPPPQGIPQPPGFPGAGSGTPGLSGPGYGAHPGMPVGPGMGNAPLRQPQGMPSPPPSPPSTAPRKKNNTGLFVLIGGVAVVGVLMLGLIIAGFVITSRSPAPTEKKPVATNPTKSTRGETKIFESYLSKVEVSYMNSAPKNNDDIYFDADHQGTEFPSGIRALVLHLEGNPPADADLTVYWSRSGSQIKEQDIGTDLRRGRDLNLSIYKTDGGTIGNGNYQVEIRQKDGSVAARVTFYVGE